MVDDLGDSAEKTTSKLGPSAAAVDAFIAYRQQERDAEEQYNRERSQIVEEYAKQRADIERDYARRRGEILADFQKSQSDTREERSRSQGKETRDFTKGEKQTEEDYYKQRTKLAQQYNTEVQRAEEDHQRKMLELQRDHNDRVADLTDQRDAMGLFREMRDYEKARSQAEEEYSIEAARRSQDFALRLSEMEAEFAQARARRLADFQQRRADEEAEFQYRQAKEQERLQEQLKALDVQHAEQLASLDKQNKEKLAELDRQYNEERIKRRNAFADQLRDLNEGLLGERSLKNKYYAAMAADLQQWVEVWKGQVGTNKPQAGAPVKGSRAVGGYVSNGLWQMHDNEYVLNANATRALEQMAGGRLTDASVMRLMLSGTANQTSVTINDQRRFDSRLNAQDRRQIQKDTAWMFSEALNG